MQVTQNNPPAFPSPSALHGHPNEGASLRDLFAGNALTGIVAYNEENGYALSEHPMGRHEGKTFADAAAEDAYIYADSMLKERSKGQAATPVSDVPDYVIAAMLNARDMLEYHRSAYEHKNGRGTATTTATVINEITAALAKAKGEKGGSDNV